jgi:C-lobe and N-lobe beta barrels of Tf-binding protein B/FecR protein
MKTGAFFCMGVFLWAISSPALADSPVKPVGTVVAVRGEASALGSDGRQRPLEMKSPVYLKDTLITGERGRLQVLFRDATLISMGPASRMTLADYKWNGSAGEMKNRVQEGFFHIMGGRIAEKSPKDFRTETPLATIGIRGSIYALSLVNDTLNVVFLGGTGIYVFNETGRVDIDRPGYGTRLYLKDRKPLPPRKLSEKELGSLLRPVAPEEKKGREGEKTAPPRGEKHPPATGRAAEAAERTVLSNRVDREIDRTQQDNLAQTVAASFSGAYLNLLQLPGLSSSTISRYATGSLSGTSRNGRLSGTGVSSTGQRFPLDVAIPEFRPAAVYAGPTLHRETLSAFPIADFSPDAPIGVDRYDAAPGEFTILSVPMESVLSGTQTVTYALLGFAGVPAIQPSRPKGVIYTYSGPAAGVSQMVGESVLEGGVGQMEMRVNWQNNHFIGLIKGNTGHPGEVAVGIPFFGTLKADRPVIDQAVFMGNIHPGDAIGGNFPGVSWITGSESGFGGFYGTAYQGFGGMAKGGVIEIQSDEADSTGEWRIAAAGFRSPQADAAPRGSALTQGFVSAMAENMTAPDRAPRLYLNQDAASFRLEMDKDAGVLTGSISATDVTDPTHTISHVEIGGAWGSAYVDDATYVALLGGSEVVTSSGKSGGLKPYGNHLEPAGPNEQLAPYTTWGYWEIAYDDPASAAPYHAHVPGSLWVAGEPTPEETINGLVQSGYQGHYQGQALGVLTAPWRTDTAPMKGQASLDIDFSPASLAPVTGGIRFSDQDINLVIDRGQLGPAGFSASFKDTQQSQLNGGFFGPNADAVAGNFAAVLGQGKAVTGIFGATAQ